MSELEAKDEEIQKLKDKIKSLKQEKEKLQTKLKTLEQLSNLAEFLDEMSNLEKKSWSFGRLEYDKTCEAIVLRLTKSILLESQGNLKLSDVEYLLRKARNLTTQLEEAVETMKRLEDLRKIIPHMLIGVKPGGEIEEGKS